MMRFSSPPCLTLAVFLFLTASCDRPRPQPKAPEPEPAPAVKTPAPVSKSTVVGAPLKIIVAEDSSAWNSQVADVKAVLDSVGKEMMRYIPNRHIEPITVYAKGGPITLYNRDSGGGYTVKLNTGDRLWAQAAFQFSHEVCHVLCNYREDKNPNGWFEESLCEVASLFTLRAMGKTWQTDPPYSNWKSYHESLTGYAQQRIDDAALLGQQPLNEWFAVREQELRKSETQRELNNVVAVKLLPLFEENPAGWESVAWINAEPSFPDDTFREYLKRWHFYVPERHRDFVEKVAREFGIEIE